MTHTIELKLGTGTFSKVFFCLGEVQNQELDVAHLFDGVAEAFSAHPHSPSIHFIN